MSHSLDKTEVLDKYRSHPAISILLAIFTAIGIIFTIDQIFNLHLVGRVIIQNRYLYVILALFLSLVFLLFPATGKASRKSVPWYDVLLFAMTIGIGGYLILHAMDILQEGWEVNPPVTAIVISVILWGLVLEAVRRTAGLVLCVILLIFSIYPVFAGRLPGMFTGQPFNFIETASYHVLSNQSMMGSAMIVFGQLVIGFMIFSIALQATGGGKLFLNLASAATGSARGGPAKVAILGSGLFGMLSGSVVSNVLAMGSVTIPAMKRLGFRKEFAGAVEACASTGGVLMPPVMGAVAFVMASFLNVPYATVCIAAIIPSVFYYFSLFVQLDAYAAVNGIQGLPKNELPSIIRTLKDGWHLIFAFVLLIYFLFELRTEAQAPFYGTLALFFLAMLRKSTRISARQFLMFLESSGKTLIELVAILAGVGLIVGSLSMTGVAAGISGDLVALAGNRVVPLLIMGAFVAFILGMGMTITAVYVIVAVIVAPSLSTLGLNTIAIHLFVLYWAMLSAITPPVCIAAIAAAGIAGASPMRTGLEATRLALILYFLPFFFAIDPNLILQISSVPQFIIRLVCSLVAIVLLAGSIQGYLIGIGRFQNTIRGWLLRLAALSSGILLFIPGSMTDVIGAGILGVLLVVKLLSRGEPAGSPGKN